MIITVLVDDMGGRHNSIAYGLEVEADVYITEDEAEVESWKVEGVRMPITALPDGMYDYLAELALEEWGVSGE
jgi:hypothetical protein